MAEHVWSVLCASNVIDRDSNAISLFNVVESLLITVEEEERERFEHELEKSGRQPIFPIDMHLVTWWVRTELEKPERVEIQIANYAPSGERGSATVSGMVDLEDHKSYRIRAEIGGLAYRGDGRYWLVIEYRKGSKWKAATRLPINVMLVTAPKRGAEAAGS